ncbi:hypothetical protein B0J12DRAFT_703776 [Macrophomina phaseolina]|uniref:Ubiquitin-like protease family profile domain-containing protein n=1 Tax=Macrophomina phaseolina TaxID=35725 RepID=A0ABQ8G089_9PEZI|nr:hypothetical protein B0J12DRAFT_703776 [Macrophomina phaseolina]
MPTTRGPSHDGSKSRQDGDALSGDIGTNKSENRPSATPSGNNTRKLAISKDEKEVDERNSNFCKDNQSSAAAPKTSQESSDVTSARNGNQATLGRSDPKMPTEIIEDSEDDSSNIVELPIKGSITTSQVTECLDAKISRLIEKALPFLSALDVSWRTLECFRPGQQFKDDAILKTLKMILPDKATPLIASFTIIKFPSLGLPADFTGFEIHPAVRPRLVHELDSTHLFVVYNVQAHSLQPALDGSGNHWILIVVDFLNTRIRLFDAEKGLETPAKSVACYVGILINDFRVNEGYSNIEWIEPEIQPVNF